MQFLTDIWQVKKKYSDVAKAFSGFDILWLSFAISLYIIFVCNESFWKAIFTIYTISSWKDILFLLAILSALIAAVNLILSVFGFKYVFKPIAILILVISSTLAFYMDSYGIMMDKSMMQNLMETDSREVVELINLKLVLHFLGFAVLPAVLVYRIKINYRKISREMIFKLGILLVTGVFLTTNALVFYKDYASLSRNNRYLRFLINPAYFFYSLNEYTQDWLNQGKVSLTLLGTDAKESKTWMERGKKTITILVLGETARAENFSLNGYQRDTNPFLKKEDIINFSQFYSCGTTTAVSVPRMFSHLDRRKFSESKARQFENILDVLKRTGIHVLWQENNSGCKGVCDRIETQDMGNLKMKEFHGASEYYDEILLQGLQEFVDRLDNNAFIVLHQKGSHGPAYYLRYPEQFKVFTPVCVSSQLDRCPRQEIVNAYDNSILYTDYFLSRVIDFLKTNSDRFYTAMIYLSDHGESLGENNIYLHGLPLLLAPNEQKHIPFIVWLSDGFEKTYGIDKARLQKISNKKFSHDNLFDSILGMLDIKTDEYDAYNDIFTYCKGS